MLLSIKGKQYDLLLRKKIIPFGLVRIVQKFNNEPSDSIFHTRGNRLNGRIALVTGGYKGIGLAITKRLIQDGAKVIITGRNSIALQSELDNLNTDNVSSIVWDVADKSVCEKYFEKARAIFGKIDILVNNAGVTTDRSHRLSFESMDKKHLHYVHDINTLGTRKMCEVFTKMFSGGTILNIISNTGIIPAKDAYYTSKWALYAYTKALGSEQVDSSFTINGLCPGPIKTGMSFGPGVSLYREEIPNHRIGLPEEIAELAFVQILAGLNGQNGEIIVCDGGESLL